MSKRIGFVDYKLDNFHANVFLKAYRTQLKDRGATVAGCTALEEDAGRAWAEKNGVPYFDDPAQLNRHVDCYMVLAPSNPEKHLELCQRVFQFGKPVYVDKTFAPDLATAQTIFDLADRHDVPVQTTSALRYTNVQAHAQGKDVRHMTAWGGGSSFAEYSIHPVEMVVSVMGPHVASLMRRGDEKYSQLLVAFDGGGDPAAPGADAAGKGAAGKGAAGEGAAAADAAGKAVAADNGGRTATINVYATPGTPYAAAVTDAKGTKLIEVDTSKLFVDTAAAILDFFESRKPNIDRAQTLAVRRILDAAANPAARERFVPLA